jgi:pSer/pThr/pTyr-binding forkhead associated (FHA) protein
MTMALQCINGHMNDDGAFFCETCGEALLEGMQGTRVCAACGMPNAAEAATCADCGAELTDAAVAANGQARLVLLSTGAVFDLTERDETVVGRTDPTCDVYPDIDLTAYDGEKGGVSRQHIRIRRDRTRYTVEDMRSINLTFLNRQRLDAFIPMTLKSGDELRLGLLVLRFEVA